MFSPERNRKFLDMEIIMSDQTKDGNMIENHLHKMVFETKINEGTGQEITLKETKQMRVSKFDENLSFDDQKIQDVDKRTIEDQHGVRSHFLISGPVQETYINGYVYVNSDGSFMTEEDKKQFEDDWKNHWAPEMTEDTMWHEINTVCEKIDEPYRYEHEITLSEGKKMNEVSRSIRDQHGERFLYDGRYYTSPMFLHNSKDILEAYGRDYANYMTEDEEKQFEEDWKNLWTPKMTEDNKKEI